MKQTKLKYSRKLAHKIRDFIRSTKNKSALLSVRVACKFSIAKFRVACMFSIAKFRVACMFRKALNAKIHLDNTSTSTQRQMKSAITILRTVMQNGPFYVEWTSVKSTRRQRSVSVVSQLQDFEATKEALRIFFNIAKFRVANKYTKVQNAKIHVGCGEYNLDGYINSDIRDLPNVHLVCKAWS